MCSKVAHGLREPTMFRFGLKNMRRLRDVRPIEIRPITILVGRNSSGKSTFLRTFPLIRQSLMTRTSSPILWYGDLVDFGEYSSVVSDGEKEDRITFSFGLDEVRAQRLPYRRMLGHEYSLGVEQYGPVDVELSIAPDEGRTRLDSFVFSYDSGQTTFKIQLDSLGNATRILHNGNNINKLFDNVYLSFSLGSLFPDVTLRPKKMEKDRYFFDESMWSFTLFKNILRGHVNRRIGDAQFGKFAYQFLSMREFSNENILSLEREIQTSSFKNLLSDIRGKNKLNLREQLRVLFEVTRLLKWMPAVFSNLRTILGSTLYIGPVRARSERYYRYQDLAVSEIDPDGKNFAMFLNSLTHAQRADFSGWVYDRFGYGVEVTQRSGHISINLKVGKHTTNIVDNGYGISQVLPVLGQIWWASRGASRRNLPPRRSQNAILVIEQPELHLHPAHQALIADAIVGERVGTTTTESDSHLQFIVETHSEALINRLGELIALNRVKADDVQVLIFEADDEISERETQVRIARFEEDGTLRNWPYGFFQPVV